jgi:hypothetical protein
VGGHVRTVAVDVVGLALGLPFGEAVFFGEAEKFLVALAVARIVVGGGVLPDDA